jgi:hypothetical protein
MKDVVDKKQVYIVLGAKHDNKSFIGYQVAYRVKNVNSNEEILIYSKHDYVLTKDMLIDLNFETIKQNDLEFFAIKNFKSVGFKSKFNSFLLNFNKPESKIRTLISFLIEIVFVLIMFIFMFTFKIALEEFYFFFDLSIKSASVFIFFLSVVVISLILFLKDSLTFKFWAVTIELVMIYFLVYRDMFNLALSNDTFYIENNKSVEYFHDLNLVYFVSILLNLEQLKENSSVDAIVNVGDNNRSYNINISFSYIQDLSEIEKNPNLFMKNRTPDKIELEKMTYNLVNNMKIKNNSIIDIEIKKKIFNNWLSFYNYSHSKNVKIDISYAPLNVAF